MTNLSSFSSRLGKHFAVFVLIGFSPYILGQSDSHIRKRTEIENGISPKSVVASGTGIFAAQNMMYRHTITFYDQNGSSLAKIKDGVDLRQFGFSEYQSAYYRGAPVEAVFSHDGQTLWVSNYHMTGPGFDNPGCDNCIGTNYDPGFVYKVNAQNYAIENVIKVGAVPKFMALSSDESTLLVSNWVSSDVSVIDTQTEKEIKRITVGKHPRGIAITDDNSKAYVALMGTTKLAVIDLKTYTVEYIEQIGKAPRSLILADGDSTLFVSLNSGNSILKYNCHTKERVSCRTPSGPRSMTLSPDEHFLYVVNYFDNTFSKIDADSMLLKSTIETAEKPIGICGNWSNGEIWVACYSGKIEIFKDFELDHLLHPTKLFDLNFLNFSFSLPTPTPVERDTVTTEIATELVPKTKLSPISKPTTENSEIENCKYHIIIGAFSVLSNAENRMNEIIALGYSGQLIPGDQLTYVSVACFVERKDADKEVQAIRQDVSGAESAWILTR